MNATIPAALAIIVYILGYALYSKYLATHVFGLRPGHRTPAHTMGDGIDYVPTRRWVLFGHHYASIAGLAPMLGPAVAVIWGWLPAMLWVVLGALLVGAVHDMGSVVVSIRARGKSMGKVAEELIGRRAKTLFHLIIFFLVSLAMGVFVYVIAFLLSPAPDAASAAIHFPQAVVPTFGLMLIAATIGWLGYRRGVPWKYTAPIGFALLLGLVALAANDSFIAALGLSSPDTAPGVTGWSRILLFYAFLAAVLPVWSLLQPRDFLNSILLYLGLGTLYMGFFVMQPEFVAPAVRMNPEGAPGLFPFVFIIIACGAASGFHSLVASGTTAKQLNNETDARPVGYGGMIGESMLGLVAVLATTAGVLTRDAWYDLYANWGAVQGLGANVGVFIQGSSSFLAALGIPRGLGGTFISLIVVSFALTSLDSATRLLRYNIEEMSETVGLPFMKNRFLSALAAAAAIGFFAFYTIDGRPAGLVLWSLFGTTNQLMAGLALLAITLYLLHRGRNWYVTGIPMAGVLIATLYAMTVNVHGFWQEAEWPLFFVGGFLLVLAAWVLVEAFLSIQRFRKRGTIEQRLDIYPEDNPEEDPTPPAERTITP